MNSYRRDLTFQLRDMGLSVSRRAPRGLDEYRMAATTETWSAVLRKLARCLWMTARHQDATTVYNLQCTAAVAQDDQEFIYVSCLI